MNGKFPLIDLGIDNVVQRNEFEEAIKKLGCVYLINHGISEILMNSAFEVSREFFEMPKETKVKYQKKNTRSGMIDIHFNTEYHGYTRPAEFQKNNSAEITEFREAFDVCGINRFYPNDEIPKCQPVFQNLESGLITLAKRISRMLAICLKKNEDYILQMLKNLTEKNIIGFTSLRSLYYPAIPEGRNVPENSTRCAAHTDFGMFTFLLQDDIGGLQIKPMDSNWSPVIPIPGAILLIMGNLWEHITSFPALVHRVDFPNEENKRKLSRQSITYFVHPDADQIIKKNGVNYGIENCTIRELTMEKAKREGHHWKKGQ